jgi:hypothetical protein
MDAHDFDLERDIILEQLRIAPGDAAWTIRLAQVELRAGNALSALRAASKLQNDAKRGDKARELCNEAIEQLRAIVDEHSLTSSRSPEA